MPSKLKDRKRSFGRSLKDCLNGISYTISHEENFRREIIIAIIVLFLGFLLKIEKSEFIFILIAIFFVLTMEIINTAIETAVDLYTKEYHELARIAKDVSAGAVLTACFFAIIVGIIIFIPRIINILGGI